MPHCNQTLSAAAEFDTGSERRLNRPLAAGLWLLPWLAALAWGAAQSGAQQLGTRQPAWVVGMAANGRSSPRRK